MEARRRSKNWLQHTFSFLFVVTPTFVTLISFSLSRSFSEKDYLRQRERKINLVLSQTLNWETFKELTTITSQRYPCTQILMKHLVRKIKYESAMKTFSWDYELPTVHSPLSRINIQTHASSISRSSKRLLLQLLNLSDQIRSGVSNITKPHFLNPTMRKNQLMGMLTTILRIHSLPTSKFILKTFKNISQ